MATDSPAHSHTEAILGLGFFFATRAVPLPRERFVVSRFHGSKPLLFPQPTRFALTDSSSRLCPSSSWQPLGPRVKARLCRARSPWLRASEGKPRFRQLARAAPPSPLKRAYTPDSCSSATAPRQQVALPLMPTL